MLSGPTFLGRFAAKLRCIRFVYHAAFPFLCLQSMLRAAFVYKEPCGGGQCGDPYCAGELGTLIRVHDLWWATFGNHLIQRFLAEAGVHSI